MKKSDIKWIIGYVDNYGAVHSKVVSKSDPIDSHNSVWPGPKQRKWRWIPTDPKSLNTYGDEFDFEVEDKIWELIKKKVQYMLNENPAHIEVNGKNIDYMDHFTRSSFILFKEYSDNQFKYIAYDDQEHKIITNSSEIKRDFTDPEKFKYIIMQKMRSNYKNITEEQLIKKFLVYKLDLETMKKDFRSDGSNHHYLEKTIKPYSDGKEINRYRLFHVNNVFYMSCWGDKTDYTNHKNLLESLFKELKVDPKVCMYQWSDHGPSDFVSYTSTFNTTVTNEKTNEIKSEIQRLKKELNDKYADLHVSGAQWTTQQKQAKQSEIDVSEQTIKILIAALAEGKENLNQVAISISKTPPKTVDDLYVQLEKQLGGLTVAQIRKKYDGIPLDKLVNKKKID